MNRVKIGVLGAGNIAGVVSRTLSAMEEVQCWFEKDGEVMCVEPEGKR